MTLSEIAGILNEKEASLYGLVLYIVAATLSKIDGKHAEAISNYRRIAKVIQALGLPWWATESYLNAWKLSADENDIIDALRLSILIGTYLK